MKKWLCLLLAAVLLLSMTACGKERDVFADLAEGDLLYDIGATSIDRVESFTGREELYAQWISFDEEEVKLFANYTFWENLPADLLDDLFLFPTTKQMAISVNGNRFPVCLLEDCRIVVSMPDGRKVYGAEEADLFTQDMFYGLVDKYASQTEATQTTEQENTGEILADLSQYPVLYQSGEHYAIYKNTSDIMGFYYIVKDQGGTVIDQGTKDYRGSFGFSYRNGLLVMDWGNGGNGGVSHRYYDVETGRVSGLFNETVADNETLVAYFSWDDAQQRMTLIVQDIFDWGNYFVQIPGDYTDCARPGSGVRGEFLENNTKLKFTYTIAETNETVSKTVTLPGRSENDKLLLEVLRNERAFITEDGQLLRLEKYKVCGQDVIVKKYTWVDFDGDGVNELVAYMDPDLAYMVFHWEQGSVYGYEFAVRGMQSLKADGTHCGSSGASVSGYYALRFKDGKCEQYELAYRDDIPGTEYIPGNEEYRMDGKPVTAAEFQGFCEAFRNKPDAFWYACPGYTQGHNLYGDFLMGKTTALENGAENTLNSYLSRISTEVGSWQYAFVDMTGDGVVELCVKCFELYVFTIKDGRVCHWYTDSNMYTVPLSDGALLYKRHGAAPTHINYEYYTLDKNGKENFRIAFSWWDGKTVEEGKTYPDRYYVNEKEVTKEEYEGTVGRYLAIDRVTWYYHIGKII